MENTPVNDKFNGEMNFLKAIAIICVIFTHATCTLLVQPLVFYIPLFYFISGYFYNEIHEAGKSKYIWSKFKKHMGGFYLYLIFMIILSGLIWMKYGFSLGRISLHSIFISPFTTGLGAGGGDAGFLLGSSWFVFSLFLVQIIFVLVYPLIRKIFKKDILQLIFFLILGTVSIVVSNKVWSKSGYSFWFEHEYLFMVLKTIIGMMFYYFGLFYKKNIENKVNIFQIKFLVLSILILVLLSIFVPNLSFIFYTLNFQGHIFLPIITTVLCFYVSIFIVRGLNKVIKNRNNFLHVIGRNSLYIMYFNYPVFFVISLLYFNINHIDTGLYKKIGTFPYIPESIINLNKFWFLYFLLAMILPTLYGEMVSKIKKLVIKA